MAKHDRSDIVYAVLTLDPSAWTGQGWAGSTSVRKPGAVQDLNAMQSAFAELVTRWTVFAKRLRRTWGDLEYVSTVESHRSGWPHLNVIMVCSDLARALKNADDLPGWTRKARGRELARRLLGGVLEGAGFGPIAFLECAGELDADGGDPLAGYIAKLAGEVGTPFAGKEAAGLVDSIGGQTVAEVVKHSQVPHKAPPNFRRLRSSKGFLPPKRRDENVTGELLDEVGRRVGVGRVERWLEICSTYRSAQPVARRLIDRAMFEWLADQDRPLGKKEAEDFARAGRVLHGLGELEPETTVPREVPLEGISAAPIRGPEDIERILGPFGPGMQTVSNRYQLRPELVYSPRGRDETDTKAGSEVRSRGGDGDRDAALHHVGGAVRMRSDDVENKHPGATQADGVHCGNATGRESGSRRCANRRCISAHCNSAGHTD
jgi:hypothetical protein